MTASSVLLVAQTETRAEPVASVLQARGFEVAVTTRASFPSALRPRAVVVVAEDLAGVWFTAVADLLRTRGIGSRTVWVAAATRVNIETVQRAGFGILYPPAAVDRGLTEVVAGLADTASWEDHASARMQGLLDVTDDLCARFVEEAFSYGPPATEVGELCRRRLYTTPSNMRSRWQVQGHPGSPKQVLDRIVALRFVWLRGRGLSVAAACRALEIHRTTIYRLLRRVAAVTPGEAGEEKLWAAVEAWVEEASGVA